MLKNLVLLFISFTACAQSHYDTSKILFDGIPVRLSFSPADEKLGQDLWLYLEKVDQIFNDYDPASEVSRLNRKPSLSQEAISPELASVIQKSKLIHKLTDACFDISSRPIRELWKQAEQSNTPPSHESIKATLANCGLDKLTLQKGQLSRSQALQLDFGGIIKGIAVDHIIQVLKKHTCRSALIQIGGETATFGLSTSGRTYRLAVPHPKQIGEIFSVIQASTSGISISTSGNSERAVTVNGIQQYHIIDPRSGQTASTKILSVSVAFNEVGKNWLCDSLSTAGVILGPKKTFEILKKLGGEGMFLIAHKSQFKTIKSSGWKQFEND